MPRDQVINAEVSAAVSNSNNWTKIAKKAIYTGAIGSAAAYFLYGEKGPSSFLDMQVPASISAGLGTSVGSITSDLLSDYVIGKIDQSDSMKMTETFAVKAGLSGLGTVAALKYGSGIDPSMEGFILGAGSKIGGDAAYNQMDPLSYFW